MVEFVNLTPHEIVIVGEDGEIKQKISPSGKIARVKVERIKLNEIGGISVYLHFYGDVEGLPMPLHKTVYIVSSLVAQATRDRDDVVFPDTSPEGVVRDSEGKIIGVKALARWSEER